MKRIFLSFLVLIMLTPSLVCHMPLCADHDGGKTPPSQKGMLLNDCMDVDWQSVDAVSVPAPDFSKTTPVVFTTPQPFLTVSATHVTANTNAPPPDVGDSPHVYKTALFLTTHRIRV